jgi:hypothetical protein
VPQNASPAAASRLPGPDGAPGMPSVATAIGSAATAAATNCTPVTATGSRSRSSRTCATVNPAEISCEASTRPSPPSVAPPPLPLATRPTPIRETAKPAHATGLAMLRCQTAVMIAMITGVAPTISAAWVTLVRTMPRFCSSTEPP